MATSHGLPLGIGARPTTGAELASRLLAAATASLAGLPLAGLDAASVVAELDGADIVSLDVDLSGVGIELTSDGADLAGPVDAAAETARAPGMLRAARIVAHPASLDGAPVDLDIAVADLAISWISRADGTVEIDSTGDAIGAANGTAVVSIAQDDLPAVATSVLNTALAEAGASVSEVAIAITADGEDAAALDATAKARYGVMSAGVRLRARLRIVDGRLLRLDGLDLSTRNLLAGALLGLAKGELEKLDGREFDLVELLPAGVRDPRVHLDVADGDVTISAAFG